MKFDHTEYDYGFRVGHSFEFKGEKVAITFNKANLPPKDEIVELLVEAMIITRIEQALDRVPVVGWWRRFKKWRTRVRKYKERLRAEEQRIIDIRTVTDIVRRNGYEVVSEWMIPAELD